VAYAAAGSFHKNAGATQDGFVFSCVGSLPSSLAAFAAMLPSALVCGAIIARCQLGVPFQQVLLPDNRPRFPSVRWGVGPGVGRVTWTRRLESPCRSPKLRPTVKSVT